MPPHQGVSVNVTTVSDNESLFTKRQVEDAKKARKLMQELGYPSSKDLIELVETGGILNCPITAHDIRRAERIYGPDIASLK
jgi:hypothetical protein